MCKLLGRAEESEIPRGRQYKKSTPRRGANMPLADGLIDEGIVEANGLGDDEIVEAEEDKYVEKRRRLKWEIERSLRTAKEKAKAALVKNADVLARPGNFTQDEHDAARARIISTL